MWRSLFLAIGIVLIITGLECLVVGQFTMAKDGKIPRFLSKLMEEANRPIENRPSPQVSPNVAPPQMANGYGGTPGASRFGPSRFASPYSKGDQVGNDSVFGIRPNQTNSANSQFSLAGFDSGPPSVTPNTDSGNFVRILHTKDWMPWSLVAAGTIIVLYTNSLVGRDYGGHDG